MHKGVDFAVPTGTPVMSAGAGTIAFMGREHGYGNFVLINHGNGYSTAYGHLSRFAPGMRNGARVRQGQIFAFSGMTGMATGPHLHYEIRIRGSQVNPLKVKMAEGRLLSGRELRDYLGSGSRPTRWSRACRWRPRSPTSRPTCARRGRNSQGTSGLFWHCVQMLIRAGYDIAFRFTAATPLLLTVNLRPELRPRLCEPERLLFERGCAFAPIWIPSATCARGWWRRRAN